MLTIRLYSAFLRRITRVPSPSTSTITQFCVAKGLVGNRGSQTSRLYHSKGPLHCKKRDYDGPTQKLIANTDSFSSMDSRPGIALSLGRGVHTAAASSNLDLTRLSNDFPDPNLWYVLTAITLTTVGRQYLVGQLWRHLASAAPDQQEVWQGGGPEQVPQGNQKLSPEMEREVVRLEQVAMRLREGLMKMSVLFGFPRVRPPNS